MSQHLEDKDHLFQIQKDRLEELKQLGIDPYGQKFKRNGLIHDFKESYEENREVILAGRITACRDMGKTKFWDLTDQSGRIQLFLHPKTIQKEEDYALLSHLNMADFIGVVGALFKTRTGEISVKVESLVLLSKALRPLPEKYHGLKDVESRFRQRYLDLIANQDVKDIFKKRTAIIQEIRRNLNDKGFLEVETPMLQSLYGGAVARPFMTHHNALDMQLYLRIAPELYLKRLLVGGFEKVFELNRNFRNEGLSRKHNPEFTMLELYSAYDNYIDMMELCEELIRECAKVVHIESELNLPSQKTTSIEKPFLRISLFDAVKQFSGLELKEWNDLRKLGEQQGILNWETIDEGLIVNELFERYVEEKLIEPTFITHFPSILCPLAKKSKADPKFSDRFELYIDGQEIANAYSELNDPVEQKIRFEEQIASLDAEEQKIKQVDRDYVRALEHGMPPAGGLGIGIDRLVMILTGAPSIREVILFPLLRESE